MEKNQYAINTTFDTTEEGHQIDNSCVSCMIEQFGRYVKCIDGHITCYYCAEGTSTCSLCGKEYVKQH